MKKFKRFVSIIFIVLISLTVFGCYPAQIPEIIPILSYETAFVVPLEGSTGNQGKFMSEEYLNDKKIAAKRITVPIKKRKLVEDLVTMSGFQL